MTPLAKELWTDVDDACWHFVEEWNILYRKHIRWFMDRYSPMELFP